MNKPSSCNGCVGNSWPDREFFAPEGTGANGVLIVLEQPLEGYQLTSFDKMLSRGGMKREDFTTHSAISCNTPPRKLRKMPYELDVLGHCHPNLDHTIHTLKPRCIVAAGDVALDRLLGYRSLEDHRGYVFWSDQYQTWVIPTYSPGYIMRGQTAKEAVWIHDIQRAVEVARDGYSYHTPLYLLDPTASDFMAWVGAYKAALLADPSILLSVDIETPTKGTDEDALDQDDPTYTIFRIGFAYKPNEAVSIPWSAEYLPFVRDLLATQSQKLFWNCPTPDQKILTSNLQWVEAGQLQVGDTLVGFNEDVEDGHRSRRYTTSIVTYTGRATEAVVAVHLSDGSIIKVTPEHPWLAKGRGGNDRTFRWIKTKDLTIGHKIHRLFDIWEPRQDFTAGYLAGIFDGEGSLCANKSHTRTMRTSVFQNAGTTLDAIKLALEKAEFNYRTYQPSRDKDNHNHHIVISGRMSDQARFLGQIRPVRLLDNFKPALMGAVQSKEGWAPHVVKIENLGQQEIVTLSTDKHTYVLEGFGAHNCSFDMPRLIANGMVVNGVIHDGMIAWHVLNSDLPKGLGYVTTFCCPDFPKWKHRSSEAPAWYNAADNDAALRNTVKIIEELKKHKLWDVYDRHVLRLDPVLSAMSRVGVWIDPLRRTEFAKQLTQLQDEGRAEMQLVVPQEAKRLQPKDGYSRTPADTIGLVEVVFGGILVKRCDRCGLLNPKKPHFKVYKKKDNPCGGAGVKEEFEGVKRWAKVLPFIPSTKQIFTYQDIKKHQKVYKGRGEDRKATTDVKAITSLIAKYPNDKLYRLVKEDRIIDKLAGSYIGRWDEIGNRVLGGMPVGRDGRCHTTFGHSPSTLRMNSSGPNLHTMPRGTGHDLQKLVKQMFVAGKGKVFWECDFSGIEAVLVGYFCGSQRYTRLAKLGVHDYFNAHVLVSTGQLLSSDLPDLAWSDSDLKGYFKDLKGKFPVERDVAKRCVHGSNYMMTPGKMHLEYPETFRTTKDAKFLQGIYFSLFDEIPAWHFSLCQQVDKTHYYRNPFGYVHRFYRVLNWEKIGGKWQSDFGDDAKRLIACGPQSTAAAIIKEALMRCYYDQPLVRNDLRLVIHDAIFGESNISWVDKIIEIVHAEMTKPIPELPLDPEWGMGEFLTINIDSKRGVDWGTMK